MKLFPYNHIVYQQKQGKNQFLGLESRFAGILEKQRPALRKIILNTKKQNEMYLIYIEKEYLKQDETK